MVSLSTDSITSSIKNQIDEVSGAKTSDSSKSPTHNFPWSGAGVSGTFFPPINLDSTRWDKLYPYRLLVVDLKKGKVVGSGDSFTDLSTQNVFSISSLFSSSSSGGDIFRMTVLPITNRWEYRLPITPQQLNISTAYAISTTATLRGVVEEHNGVKFKMISMAGTFGNWPGRLTIGKSASAAGASSLQTLFSGTIQAAQNVGSTIGKITSLFNSSDNFSQTPGPEKGAGGMLGTGYAFAVTLSEFLDQYAESKKDPANAGWALVLDIPKQNQSFVVSPMGFDWLQAVDAPTQIKFRLQLKAWKRIDITSFASTVSPSTQALNPNTLQRIMNGVQNLRILMGQTKSLIQAVRSDVQKPFNILRETTLFVKGLAGVVPAVIDLPGQVIEDTKSSVKEAIKTLSPTLIQTTSSNTTRSSLQALNSSSIQKEGLSDQAIKNGQLGLSAKTALLTDPTNQIFSNPDENFEILNAVSIDQLNVTPAQQEAIDTEIQNVSLITVDDLIVMRGDIQLLASQLADAFGAGDATVNTIFGKSAPKTRLQQMTIDEYALLKALYDVIESYDILTATQEIDNGRIETSMQYVEGLAQDVGMAFDSSSSKFLAPVPFKLTPEAIALRYLGDAQKWPEIATLNALRSPYIDEDGFEKPFLSNASGRLFNVGDIENLYINQQVTILSNVKPPQTRRIIDIQKINDTNYLISVDGQDNLDTYTSATNARMRAYLPGTVNSQNKIWIPSNIAPGDDLDSRPIPALAGVPLVGLSKVDLLLDDSGDVAINAYGDFRLSAGMTNLIQALKMKFLVPYNKLLLHPTYGAGVEVGSPSADVNAKELFNQVNQAILLDSRFSGIDKLEIVKQGPKMSLSVSVRLANGKGIFPLSFQIQ